MYMLAVWLDLTVSRPTEVLGVLSYQEGGWLLMCDLC